MKTLYTLIRETAELNPDGDPQLLAAQLLEQLSKEDLVGLLADAIAAAQRDLVRVVEYEASRGVRQAATAVTQKAAMTAAPVLDQPSVRDAFRQLLEKQFSLGNGEKVSWGAATLGDHQTRIVFLTKHRDGVNRTIDLHQKAVVTITEAGVSCLNDIPEEMRQAA